MNKEEYIKQCKLMNVLQFPFRLGFNLGIWFLCMYLSLWVFEFAYVDTGFLERLNGYRALQFVVFVVLMPICVAVIFGVRLLAYDLSKLEDE